MLSHRKLQRSISEQRSQQSTTTATNPGSASFVRQGRPLRSALFRAKERPRFASLSFIRSHMSSAHEVMTIGDTCLEDQYLEDLTRKVVKFLQLKRQGSLLSFGGRHWKFGKIIAKQVDAKTLVYADDHVDSLREAEQDEEDEILTIECDMNDTNQIIQLGKYDGMLMKEVLERVHDLDKLLPALYKIMKLNSRVVILARLRPTIPLPKRILERWNTAAPDYEVIKTTAERHEFTCEEQTFTYSVKVKKEIWEMVLRERSLPFTTDLKDEEIDEFMSGLKQEELEFDDEIQLIALVKEMQD